MFIKARLLSQVHLRDTKYKIRHIYLDKRGIWVIRNK